MRGPDEYIRTHTGRKFWPMDPWVTDIVIEDIGHALSNICRWGGHCGPFYSVAQHSVFVSDLLAPELALDGLLHDASEAYLLDLPKPIKQHLPGYEAAEARLLAVIAHRFDFNYPLVDAVKAADRIALVLERASLLGTEDIVEDLGPDVTGIELPQISQLLHTIRPLPPSIAREMFLQRFRSLYVESKAA